VHIKSNPGDSIRLSLGKSCPMATKQPLNQLKPNSRLCNFSFFLISLYAKIDCTSGILRTAIFANVRYIRGKAKSVSAGSELYA